MKKKYFTPEMEELEVDSPELLVGSCGDELPSDSVAPCVGESIDPGDI